MSLKDLAQQMKARGRNGDTELIHMTKGEVAGLQQLAEAAGGTLTRNPDTGLPEASFLRQILPTVIGVGLAPFTGGMSAAMMGAGAGALLNRDDPLMGAVTGGLGAFGGHGLGTGLSAAGAAGAAAPTAGAIGQGASLGATQGATMGATQGLTAAAPSSLAGSQYALAGGPSQYSLASGATPMATSAVPASAAPTTFSNMGQGLQSLMTNPSDTIGAMGGGMNVAKSGAMGLAPLLMPVGNRGPSGMPAEEEDDEDLMGRYEYDPGYTGGRQVGSAFTGERMYFEPEYRRRMAQGGAVKKFADGGKTSGPSSDPAQGMSGESAEAMRYLNRMGKGPGTSGEALDYLYGRVPAVTRAVQAPVRAPTFVAPNREQRTLSSTEGHNRIADGQYAGMYQADQPQYVYDPGTQQYYRTDPVFKQQTFFGGLFDGFRNTDYDSHLNPFGFTGGYAKGGITSLADGGFVLAADIPSAVGEGNTEAGYREIAEVLPGAMPIRGKDKGQADTVKTSIEGKQPARVAHGEMYVPPETVKKAGGAKKLYAMMDKVREQATGNKKQIKPVDIKKALA